MEEGTDGRTDGGKEGRTDGWMEGRTDGWMDRRRDGQTDGGTDKCRFFVRCRKTYVHKKVYDLHTANINYP